MAENSEIGDRNAKPPHGQTPGSHHEESSPGDRESPPRPGETETGEPPGLRTPPPRGRRERPARIERQRPLRLSNLERIVFPEAGFTKRDVIEYYESISPWLLPCLHNRPVTIERYPEDVGPDAPHFWQKNIPAYYPDWIPRIALPTEEGKPVEYALVNDLDTLVYLVNLGAITFHVFLSKTTRLDRPDFVLFDIDPGDSTFANAVVTARQLHLTLDALDVPSYPKTSGKTGLHLLAPWERQGGYDEARAWAMWVARQAAELSDLATTERLKSKRDGRVYIDVIQNALGRHIVPPYVLRGTPRATVSTPIDWNELSRDLNPADFNLKTVLPRAERKRPAALQQLFSR